MVPPPRYRPQVPIDDDDELLEECDEPVPLPDPTRHGRPIPPSAGGQVLPEDLKLLPGSGSFPGVPRPQ
jgi:hypothetical protein